MHTYTHDYILTSFQEYFISPAVFGDILYQHFLFDIPKIFDLCSIYGQENSALLGKMISNIFTNQPRYSQDLTATVDSTYEVCLVVIESLVYKVYVKSRQLTHILGYGIFCSFTF